MLQPHTYPEAPTGRQGRDRISQEPFANSGFDSKADGFVSRINQIQKTFGGHGDARVRWEVSRWRVPFEPASRASEPSAVWGIFDFAPFAATISARQTATLHGKPAGFLGR